MSETTESGWSEPAADVVSQLRSLRQAAAARPATVDAAPWVVYAYAAENQARGDPARMEPPLGWRDFIEMLLDDGRRAELLVAGEHMAAAKTAQAHGMDVVLKRRSSGHRRG